MNSIISKYYKAGNRCLYKDFSESSKIVFDLGTKRVKLQDLPSPRISSHTAIYTYEAIQNDKMCKQRRLERQNEIKRNKKAEKSTKAIIHYIETLEKKIVNQWTQLENQFKQISDHIKLDKRPVA